MTGPTGRQRRARIDVSPVLLAVAAGAIGLAIQIYDGEYKPTWAGNLAIGLVTLGIVAAAVALVGPGSSPAVVQAPRDFTNITFCVLLLIELSLLLVSRPDSADHAYLQPWGMAHFFAYRLGTIVAAGIGLIAIVTLLHLSRHVRLGPTAFLASMLLLFVSLAGWSLYATHVAGSDTTPRIDVVMFQQQGARALLHGRDPYAIDDFPDIYTDPATGKARQEVYGPGMSDGRVLRFGFPYLPASLYLAALGYIATGDFQAAQVGALVLSAILMYQATRAPVLSASRRLAVRSQTRWTAALAAMLLLFTPRVFFILISGWTEPFLVLWMSAAVYCACRGRRWLPIPLGMLLATKQYMALAVLPMSVLLVPGGTGVGWRRLLPCWSAWLKLLALMAAVALVITAPLALWNLKRFYFSVVTVQQYSPFRWDALSYLTWHAFGHGPPSGRATIICPAVLTAIAAAACLWRAPRTPAGFAGSVGLVLLVFFAFSKQAFANYYFFVIGAFCCAAAVSGWLQVHEPVTVSSAQR